MIPGVIPNSGARLLYYYPHCTVAWRSLDHVENMVLLLVVASAEESILLVALKDYAVYIPYFRGPRCSKVNRYY